jgi:U5 small nuclear ribonucleoprotein component
MLDQIGVRLKKEQYNLDPKPLLRLVCSSFFGTVAGFVDMCVTHFPAPNTHAAKTKVTSTYTGDLTSAVGKGMIACDPKAPLMIHVTKLYPRYVLCLVL